MTFDISSEQILGFCALVTALWGVWKIVKELKKPNDELKHKVCEQGRLIQQDDDRLKEIEESNKKLLQSVVVIINHLITGNGIDKMKDVRDELNDFLINK
jgi:hypothetical protein